MMKNHCCLMTALFQESITSGYFGFINYQLRIIQRKDFVRNKDRGFRDRCWSILKGVEMLELFCKWLETWEYSSIIDDDILSTFSVIWSKDLFPILKQLADQVHDGSPSLESVMSDLEGMIAQSKQLVDGWCWNPVLSSSMMLVHYKFSLFHQELDYIHEIRKSVIQYRVSRGNSFHLELEFIEKIPLSYKVLKKNIKFLESAFNQVNLGCPEGEENLRFMNFAGSYANNVAWFTCLYWAKGDQDNEFVSEILFDMSHKFIPDAYIIIPFLAYNITLDTDDIHLESDFFRIGELVERLVDFFFHHLAEVLGNDFVFLRDRLIFLFTFLAVPPPCESEIAKEGDIIRSYIYAILHQDEYLLSNFKEMKKDFRHQKTLFSAFMNRIDTVNDKIRQVHRGGSSDSWITLELEKITYNYFPSLHREISWLQKKDCSMFDRVDDMKQCKMGLRFLRMSFLWLATWDDSDEEIELKLSSVITSFQGTWGQEEGMGHLAHRFRWEIQEEIQEQYRGIKKLYSLLHELHAKIRQSTLETTAWRVDLFHLKIRFKTSTSYKILKFLDSILDNLNDLVSYRATKIIPFMKQIETLEGKLIFLKNLLKLAVNCKHCHELGEFKIFVQAFAHDAARLSFRYWTEQGENDMSASAETNSMLSCLLQKIKPTTPDVARLYIGILKSICAHRSDSHIFGRTAFSFVQLLLADLVTHLEANDLQILQDNIVFLLSFLNDPPDQNGAESLCSQIDVLFWKDLYGATLLDDGNEGCFSLKKAFLSDFMIKIEAINARIRCNYCQFPDSSKYNFPKVIPPQFLDFLLKKLKSLMDKMNNDRKYVPFVKYKMIKIEEQLASLSPFSVNVSIFDSQNETWLEVVNVLYLTEYVIMSSISSLFVFDHPLWYHMAYLSKVFDELQAVKAKLETIKIENIINNARVLPSPVAFVSEVSERVVGFEDEKQKIIDMLTRESKVLEIVSICGMGGSGKTTLAKQIFNSLQSHFEVVAFCCISVSNNIRKLLLDIISYIKGVDDKRRDMTDDDLAHELCKCLSRRRYLVVLDDIWDVSAWDKVKQSFPDHGNGSRVMFTSRSREVAENRGNNYFTHKLRLMSDIESWELFQKKVFRNDISPPADLHEIGKQIAKNCKGLPLAVVVIGGLLARTEKSLKWWSEVERGLAYYLSEEGCMDILELSYKHLPENLKPCFIYLGAFPEDSLISVKRVIRLWIAEGFVQEENVATQFVHDLIDRSLIIVGERSCSGDIKRFRVHDLIRELCVKKCRDGNFFELNHGIASSSTSSHSISNARTLCNFSGETHLRNFRLLQVLDDLVWETERGEFELNSLIHLRYIDVGIDSSLTYIPLLISNLGNVTYLQLDGRNGFTLPDSFWRMKSLRQVKLSRCFLRFPEDDGEEDNEAYVSSDQILDKVVSFSKPVLYTQKDVKWLHQRLPALRKLSCYIKGPTVRRSCYIYKGAPFEFLWELESLKLENASRSYEWTVDAMKFPSTLKKLTAKSDIFRLQNGRDLSAIAEKLNVLEVLKLKWVHSYYASMPRILETEDLVFQKLKFFEIDCYCFKKWKAIPESFPLLEQLVITDSEYLKELPPCLVDIPTLKRIVLVPKFSKRVEISAFRIKEEVEELGTQLELIIKPSSHYYNQNDHDDDDDDEDEDEDEDDDDDDLYIQQEDSYGNEDEDVQLHGDL